MRLGRGIQMDAPLSASFCPYCGQPQADRQQILNELDAAAPDFGSRVYDGLAARYAETT